MLREHPRLRLERFPSYAPELNPDEGVWNLAKHDLANGCPKDLDDLMQNLVRSVECTPNIVEAASRLCPPIRPAPFLR